MKSMILIGIVTILLASCAAPQSMQIQAASAAAAVVPTATRVQSALPAQPTQPTPTTLAQATVTPSVTATSPAPTATPISVSSPTASIATSATSSAASSAVSGVRLSLNPNKYSAPTLLTPDNNATYHVSQPVVHLAWTATPTDLMTFGQTTACVSDATNFRRAFESYQLVIHSLDGSRPDIVQWTENSTTFDWNLTTVPQGRYSWSVNVVTLCESYVVGQRSKTITRSLLSPASPTSVVQTINWVP